MERRRRKSGTSDGIRHETPKNANKHSRSRKRNHVKGVLDTATRKRRQASPEYFVGIDMHKKFMQVAVMDSDGTILQNKRIECDTRIVQREFTKLPSKTRYVLESSSV